MQNSNYRPINYPIELIEPQQISFLGMELICNPFIDNIDIGDFIQNDILFGYKEVIGVCEDAIILLSEGSKLNVETICLLGFKKLYLPHIDTNLGVDYVRIEDCKSLLKIPDLE